MNTKEATNCLSCFASICKDMVEALAMVADNKEREIRGEALAWPGSSFMEVADSLAATMEALKI